MEVILKEDVPKLGNRGEVVKVAEGYGRNSTGEYKQFLGMARGSNSEVETQLVIAKELGYGNAQTIKETEDLCIEVGKMLRAILRKL